MIKKTILFSVQDINISDSIKLNIEKVLKEKFEKVIYIKDEFNGQDKTIKYKFFREILKKIKYSRVYLNTPVRPPAESYVNMVSKENMKYAVEQLHGISIDMLSSGSFYSEIDDHHEAVLSLCKRHPMNQFELRSFLASRNVENIEELVQEIENDEKIIVIDYKGIKTYRLK